MNITKQDELTRISAATDWRSDYEVFLMRKRTSKTIDAYMRDVNLFGAWFEAENGEQFRVTSVSGVDLRAYARIRKETVKPSTWNRQHASLKVFCDWAFQKGYVLANPFQDIPRAEEVELPPRWMKERDFRRLARKMEHIVNEAHTDHWRKQAWRDRAMMSLMLYAGLRVGEVVALNVADLTIGERSGKVVILKGKGNKRREVKLGPESRRALALWLSASGVKSGALFPGKKTERITTKQAQRRVKAIGEACGLVITPHDLRHTFAHRYLEAHGNTAKAVKMLSKLLGHADMKTTWRYAQPGEEDYEASMEAF